MLIGGVLNLLIVLSVLSQYKPWTLGHGHNSSTAWFLTFDPPENGDQDELGNWLYGPVKKSPFDGLDSLLKWLYGPFLTQVPSKEPVEIEENLLDTVPHSVPDDIHESNEPEIEINDPHDIWLNGPNPDYLIHSESEGNVFMDH